MKERVCIFGGMFNPPHLGHIKLARAALNYFNFSRLVIVPSFIPPHKDVISGWGPYVRYFMAGVAFFCFTPEEMENKLKEMKLDHKVCKDFLCYYEENFPLLHDERIYISDYEILKGGKSYTIDTVRFFREKNPSWEIYLLIGMDEAYILDKWKDVEKLKDLVTFIVGERSGFNGDEIKAKYPFLRFFPFDKVEISSTLIRKCIEEKKDFSRYVPTVIRLFLECISYSS